MTDDDTTSAGHKKDSDEPRSSTGDGPVAVLKRGGEGPVMTEVPLGGTVPRNDPDGGVELSGDLYIRLEGRIYGPFSPDLMEEILQSGRLTGLEVASPDLKRWTPLAYHPRIVRGRVRDFDKAHSTLRDLSALPARKHESTPLLPLADVVRRPGRSMRDDDPGVTVEETPSGRLHSVLDDDPGATLEEKPSGRLRSVPDDH